MIYLIQGVWFQELSRVGIAHGGRLGTAAVIQTVNCRSMYMGLLKPSEKNPDELKGSVVDAAGEAELFQISLSDEKFSFSKQYLHREDIIRYAFVKQPDGTWKGGYRGTGKVGEGRSKCILTIVPDDFLVIE